MKLFSKIENSKDITDKGYVDEFYKKPTSGIPKSDLASAVQTSLGKADAAVPNTRKVNNKALSSDITLSASDVGALPDTTVIPTKVSDLTNDSGFTTNTGTVTSVSVKMNGVTKGPVTSSGTIDLGTVITSHQDISDKANLTGGNTFTGKQTLNSPASDGYSINAAGYIKGSWLQASATSNKGANTGKVCVFDDNGWVYYRTPKEVIIDAECAVKYEVKKTIDFGNSGALYIGKFNVYDTNVTCEITSTTGVTYSGKLVIATQNYVIKEATVYGDAANTVAPNFFIKPSSASDPYIEVYFKPTAWSKNVVHIYGSAITAEPTDVCTNVSSVPSTATLKPTNALNSKANLNVNNVFTGTNNKFKGITTGANDTGTVGFEVVQGEEAGGDVLFAVDERGIQMDPYGLTNVPLIVNESTGTSGQVLTSQGAGKTPIWEYVNKHGYTQLTNEDLNTIIEPGWYIAAVNNTCTNRPSPIGVNAFILVVEKGGDANIKQTLYRVADDVVYSRYTIGTGGSWLVWRTQRLVFDAYEQTFSGRKTFSDGINLTASLQVRGSAGSVGQVLTSTGTGTPQWTTLSNNVMTGEPEVNGASYTVFDSGQYGSFIGVFNTEVPNTGLQITVGRAVYTISSTNEQSVAYRLTIDKGEYNVYSTIVVLGGTVDKSSDFGLIPTDGVVSISTNLASSFYESNTCVIIWG